MQYACICNCSVCPFACNKNQNGKIEQIVRKNPIPDVVQNNIEKIAENTELQTVPDGVISVQEYDRKPNNADLEQSSNLPVLADIQYSVKDKQKKSVLKLFKKETK